MTTMATKGKEELDFTAEKLDVCLKKKQSEAVLAFLSGKDDFVSLLTGYSKSLVYGIWSIVFDFIKPFFCHVQS